MNLKNVYATITLILLVVNITSPLRLFGVSNGKCATSPNITEFSLGKFNGTWYEIERFSSIFEYNLKCVVFNYSYVNSSFMLITNHANFKSQNLSIKGEAVVIDPQKPNSLKFTFPISLKSQTLLNLQGEYQVWSTDYTTYALIYSCVNKKSFFGLIKYKLENAWILSRTPTLNSTLISQLKAKLSQIDIDNFEHTIQNCW